MSTVKLDITKEHCPMTFVKTKIALERMAVGDVLEVLLTTGEPLDNVPKSATEQGYTVHSTTQISADVYQVTISK